MRRCPKCGRYMENHMESMFGGAYLVYTCSCSYSSKESNSGMYMSNRTTSVCDTVTNNTKMLTERS